MRKRYSVQHQFHLGKFNTMAPMCTAKKPTYSISATQGMSGKTKSEDHTDFSITDVKDVAITALFLVARYAYNGLFSGPTI